MIPINRAIALRIQAASRDMLAKKDERTRLVAEVVRGVRAVKILGWEDVFVKMARVRGWGGDNI